MDIIQFPTFHRLLHKTYLTVDLKFLQLFQKVHKNFFKSCMLEFCIKETGGWRGMYDVLK